jgi:hypothetical protein
MSRERQTDGFMHGLRVRMGSLTGPKGKLLHCTRRNGDGQYWKVRLESGDWVWPDRLLVDGPGDTETICAECNLPCIVRRGDRLCARCDEDAFGTRARAAEPADDPAARRNWIRRHRTQRGPIA